MSHLHRFFAPLPEGEPVEVPLPPEEAHHALRVVRLREGDRISVFDGKGREIEGTLIARAKKEAAVAVLRRIEHPAPPVEVTIAVAFLHREKAHEDVVRRAVELGVSHICFWKGDHSQKACPEDGRWEKIALEACKQSGRFFLPSVHLHPSLDALLQGLSGPVIVALPAADPDRPARVKLHDKVAVLIGPEGDFSERETRLVLEHGACPVNLGKFLFRSEVAAAIVMALLAGQLGELGPGFSVDRAQDSGMARL